VRLSGRESQFSDPGEVAEVGVAGDETDVVVDAALGNQGVRKSSAVLTCNEFCAQLPSSLPVFGVQFQQRKPGEHAGHGGGELGIAQELRQDHRWKTGLTFGQGAFYESRVVTRGFPRR